MDLSPPPGPLPKAGAAPAFDPELHAALAALGGAAREPLTAQNLAARQEQDAAARPRPTARDLRADGRFEVDELRVPGAQGGPDVTLVSARPAGLAGPLPLLYYMHGGGMIMGNAWSVLPELLRSWALPLELAVVSVEYRLAPRTRYPGPLEDCYAGLVWAAEHADALGIDADRIVIGGKSAGGGLAAALALLTRDRGGLGCRSGDCSCARCSTTAATPSPAISWPGSTPGTGPPTPPRGRPCSATCTARRTFPRTPLPPGPRTCPGCLRPMSTSGRPRRSGTRTWPTPTRSGGPSGQAELHVWPGAFHGFDSLAPDAALSRDARDARDARTRWLRRVLTPVPGPPTV